MRILIASAFLLLACSFVLVTAENIATLSPPAAGGDQPEYLPSPVKSTPDPRIIRARVVPPLQNPADIAHLLPDGKNVYFGPNVIESQADKFPLPGEEVISSEDDPNPPPGQPNADGIIEEVILEQEKAEVKEKIKAVPVVKADGSVDTVMVKQPVIQSQRKNNPVRPAPIPAVHRQVQAPAGGAKDQPTATTNKNNTAGNGQPAAAAAPTTPKPAEPLSTTVIVLIVLGVLVLVIGIGAVVFFLIRKKKKEQDAAAAGATGTPVPEAASDAPSAGSAA